jgi:hypothetical protein
MDLIARFAAILDREVLEQKMRMEEFVDFFEGLCP